MEAMRIIEAVVLFAVAVLLALRTLYAGADGRWKGIGFVGSFAAFAAALWAALTLL